MTTCSALDGYIGISTAFADPLSCSPAVTQVSNLLAVTTRRSAANSTPATSQFSPAPGKAAHAGQNHKSGATISATGASSIDIGLCRHPAVPGTHGQTADAASGTANQDVHAASADDINT